MIAPCVCALPADLIWGKSWVTSFSVDSASWTLQIVVKEESLESSFKSKACVLISLRGVVLGGANPSLRTVCVLPMLFPFLKASVRPFSKHLPGFQPSWCWLSQLLMISVASHTASSFQIGCYAAMKKKIYAMGGGSYGKLFESVECYDPRTQQWTAICPLKERRWENGDVGCAEPPSLGFHVSLLLNGSFIWLAIWFM